MLHNSGPYGPNDAPVNMGAPVNMSQMASQTIGHNLNNLGKIAQQPPLAPTAHYNLPDYSTYSHPSLSMTPQVGSFPAYHSGFQQSYMAQNQPSIHDTSWQNGMLPQNLNAQSNHSQNMLNYVPNFEKRPQNMTSYKEPSAYHKNLPISIPHVPMKAFPKLDNSEPNYGLYNVNQDSFNPYVNHNLDLSTKTDKPYMDNSRRRSLENTVRLIENILINTTKNKDAQREQEIERNRAKMLATVSPVSIGEHEDVTPENSLPDPLEETEAEVIIPDGKTTETEVVIIPRERKEENGTKMQENEEMLSENEESSESEEDVKPNIMENHLLHLELEQEPKIDVKVESMYWTDTDFQNPFHRDVNGVPRDDVTDTTIVDCESSVNEATVVVKSESNPECYYECPHCPLVFKNPKRFLIHTKWHTFGLTNEKRMEIARNRETLRNQRKEARVVDRMNSKEVTDEVTGKKVFPCKDCDKLFCSKGSLKNHRQRLHPTRVRECKLCGLAVFGWVALRAHVAAHTDAGGYNCTDCGKSFKHAHSLAKHRDTHLEKTLECHQCPKKFGSTSQLKMHQKVHERAQRGTTFHCSYCAKGFYEAYNLAVHERTHRNERPFLCEICNTSFGTNSSLKRHLKVSHNSAKPYECSTCHRSFVSERIKSRHEMRVHGDPTDFKFTCEHCSCRYLKLKDLQKHVYKAHPKGKRKKQNGSDSE